jgi:hypothetical protein
MRRRRYILCLMSLVWAHRINTNNVFSIKKTTVRFFRVQKIWGLYIGQKRYFSPSICQYIYSLRTIFLPLFLSILLFYFTLQVPLIFLLRSPPPPLPSNINRYFPPPVFSKIHLHPCRKFCQLSNIFTLLSEQVPRRRKSSTSYRNRCTSITFCSSLSPCNSSASLQSLLITGQKLIFKN